MLPANVRLDWKVTTSYKHSSLFGLIISDEEKKFYNIDIRCQSYKTFFSSSLMAGKNKVQCFHLASFPGKSNVYK